MMSKLSGFIVGTITVAGLATLFAHRPGIHSGELAERRAQAYPPAEHSAQPGADKPVTAVDEPLQAAQPGLVEGTAAVDRPELDFTPEHTLEQRWANFAARADSLPADGEFPWRSCFTRAAASHELPEPLLLAIASGESNFDPAARSDKDAVGLMQIRWPDTSRHLGVLREADLYDPCLNVDAGARYLVELAAKFDNNLHLVVAAYNYGPGRIESGQMPEGARWYSQYIYQHLQRVLGREHIPTSELIPAATAVGGHQVLMTFNASQRARDFISFLSEQVPGLNLQQQSESLGRHDVLLLYRSESERAGALDAIAAAGVMPLGPQPTRKRYL
jgi:soluble lytic murein transglycosylase-like protein